MNGQRLSLHPMSARARFASDNYAGAQPEVLDGDRRGQQRPRASPTATTPWTAPRRRALPRAVRRRGAARSRSSTAPARTSSALQRGHATVGGGRSAPRPRTSTSTSAARPSGSAGFKLLTVADARRQAHARRSSRPRLVRFGDEHAVQPRVVSITQSTELGTLYTPDEIARARRAGARARDAPARRRRAARQRGRGARRAAARDHDRRRRRRRCRSAARRRAAAAARRSCSCAADLGDGVALPAQAVDAARVEDALPRRRSSTRCSTDDLWRAHRRARQRDGAAAGRRGRRHRRRRDHPARCRRTACSRSLPPGATEELQRDWRFYIWDETHGRGALDVLAGTRRAEDVDAFAAAGRTRSPPDGLPAVAGLAAQLDVGLCWPRRGSRG